MTILSDYHHFNGIGLATGYITNVLAYQGSKAPHTGEPITETLVMGISGGISAGYFSFEYEGHLPHVHFLTRYIFNDDIPPAILEQLAIPMNTQQTTDAQKGMANVVSALANGKPPIVWVDSTSLPYNAISGDHDVYMVAPVVVYGCDMNSNVVHIADRARVSLTATIDEMMTGRTRIKKTRNRMMTLGEPDLKRLPAAVEHGIHLCIDLFTGKSPVGSPQNFGISAFEKWATLLNQPKDKASWAKRYAPGIRMFNGLLSSYDSLETYFTGGHGARGMYADFLDEAALILKNSALNDAANQYRACVPLWAALTDTLLPDEIAVFQQAKDLLKKRYTLFVDGGNSTINARLDITAKLEGLKTQADSDFPLNEKQAVEMRSILSQHVLAVRDAEKAALDTLIHAASYSGGWG
jgi:hypothetical protein